MTVNLKSSFNEVIMVEYLVKQFGQSFLAFKKCNKNKICLTKGLGKSYVHIDHLDKPDAIVNFNSVMNSVKEYCLINHFQSPFLALFFETLHYIEYDLPNMVTWEQVQSTIS